MAAGEICKILFFMNDEIIRQYKLQRFLHTTVCRELFCIFLTLNYNRVFYNLVLLLTVAPSMYQADNLRTKNLGKALYLRAVF